MNTTTQTLASHAHSNERKHQAFKRHMRAAPHPKEGQCKGREFVAEARHSDLDAITTFQSDVRAQAGQVCLVRHFSDDVVPGVHKKN